MHMVTGGYAAVSVWATVWPPDSHFVAVRRATQPAFILVSVKRGTAHTQTQGYQCSHSDMPSHTPLGTYWNCSFCATAPQQRDALINMFKHTPPQALHGLLQQLALLAQYQPRIISVPNKPNEVTRSRLTDNTNHQRPPRLVGVLSRFRVRRPVALQLEMCRQQKTRWQKGGDTPANHRSVQTSRTSTRWWPS